MKKFFQRLFDDEAPFYRVLLPILALRLGIYCFTFIFHRMTQGGQPGFWDTFQNLWDRWDAQHYVQIAENGYVTGGDQAKNIAFFPLYGLAVAALHAILRFTSTLLVGMLVSNVASLVGLRYLHKLTAKRWGNETADRAVLYVATFPTAYFFLATYTEALFFLFVVGAFWYLDEERWFEAALWAALASATRLSGALVAVCWLVHWIKKKGWRPSIRMWPLLLAPAGLYFYLIVNQVVWGTPFKFLEFQRTAWHHEPAMPWRGFVVVLDYVFGPLRDMRAWWYRDIAELVAALIAYLASVAVFWKIGLAEGLYVLGTVILWTSNTWWMSGPRFCLVLFPMFMYLASRAWPKAVHRSLWLFGATAQVAFATAFTLGNWAF